MKCERSAYIDACGKTEIKTVTSPVIKDWQRVAVTIPIREDNTRQTLYLGTATEAPFEVRNVSLRLALPSMNPEFIMEAGATEPKGWNLWQHPQSQVQPAITSMGSGHVKVFGSNYGMYFPMELKDFIGKRVELSTELKCDTQAYLDAWGKKDLKACTTPGNKEWQSVSLTFSVSDGDSFQRFFVGSTGNAPLEVRNVRLNLK